MAKGMLSLTVALLLSTMCAVEGQSAASGAAAAGGGGGLGGGPASAAAAAVSGIGYGRPEYGRYGNGYRPQYVYNSVPNTYLPPGVRYSSSYVRAAKRIKSASGVGILDDLLNNLIDAKILNNNVN